MFYITETHLVLVYWTWKRSILGKSRTPIWFWFDYMTFYKKKYAMFTKSHVCTIDKKIGGSNILFIYAGVRNCVLSGIVSASGNSQLLLARTCNRCCTRKKCEDEQTQRLKQISTIYFIGRQMITYWERVRAMYKKCNRTHRLV